MESTQVRCRLSDPSQPHYLCLRSGPLPSHCFTCGDNDLYYKKHFYCEACNVHFHEDCAEYPRKMRHPYHPKHPLTFTFDKSGSLVCDGNLQEYYKYLRQLVRAESDNIYGKCDRCGKDLKNEFYRCSVCSFRLCFWCSRIDPPLSVANPRSHEHALSLFHRPLLTPCDACGLVDVGDPAYTCLRCDYVVHRRCMDLPRVIKITYHSHRLSHILFLPPQKWSCGVCYRNIDVKYGAYSCTEGCSSVFHSKCATQNGIWDGKELEWKLEEPDDTKDIEPFEKIGDGEIRHFSHKHHLWLNQEGSVRDTHKQCQACVLPIESGDFYSCMQCDFFLHIICASLPRKKEHVLHCHPLKLELPPGAVSSLQACSACGRIHSGFRYRCDECGDFKLDVRCASIYNSFSHINHQHPLMITNLSYRNGIACLCCGITSYTCLKCIDGCDFILCFGCATLPCEIRYKYDEHPLTLCCGEEDANGPYWCEVCEGELDPKKWFYTCNKCCVTLHLQCLFGPFVYLKYGSRLDVFDIECEIVRNNSSTRLVCSTCRERCPDVKVLKAMDNEHFCSYECIQIKQLEPRVR